MAELHVMEVRWSGRADMATALQQAAEAHDCSVSTERDGEEVTLIIGVQDVDLQALRDRVDALLVALGDVEESLNG